MQGCGPRALSLAAAKSPGRNDSQVNCKGGGRKRRTARPGSRSCSLTAAAFLELATAATVTGVIATGKDRSHHGGREHDAAFPRLESTATRAGSVPRNAGGRDIRGRGCPPLREPRLALGTMKFQIGTLGGFALRIPERFTLRELLRGQRLAGKLSPNFEIFRMPRGRTP